MDLGSSNAPLIALGFAQRLGNGSLVATATGRAHLDARGIAFAAKAPNVVSRARRYSSSSPG